MVNIPDNVKRAIVKQDVFPVATSTTTGIPNVAYVKYLKVLDDHRILIGDNYFDKTKENIVNNKQLSFVVLDEEKGSFQIKGTAERLTKGELFEQVQQWVSEKFPRVAAVVLNVEKIYSGAEIICQ